MNYRKKFPVTNDRNVLPEHYLKLTKDQLENDQKLYEPEPEEAPLKDSRLAAEEILDRNIGTIAERANKKMLHEAKEERTERQKKVHEIEIRRRRAQLRKMEMKRKIDENYQKVVDENLNKLLLSTIEILAEEEALEFVKNIAANIDNDAWSSTESDSEVVKKSLREILVPEILKSIENEAKSDE